MQTILFTVTEQDISPAGPVYAGVQGDHRAVKVEFLLPASWLTKPYKVRIEYVDGAGGFDSTTFLTPENGRVSVWLPESWTAPGGMAEIRVAAALLGEVGQPEQELIYSKPGKLFFASRDSASQNFRDKPEGGLSALIADATSATAEAQAAADGAHAAEMAATAAAARAENAASYAETAGQLANAAAGEASQAAQSASAMAQLLEQAIAEGGIKGEKGDKGDPGLNGGNRNSTLVIGSALAGYTLSNCDYLCNGDNDRQVIEQAIAALPSSGGKIVLLNGSYYLNGPSNEVWNVTNPGLTINKPVVIEGCGVNNTHLYQTARVPEGALIQVKASNVTLRNLHISSSYYSNSVLSVSTSSWAIENFALENCYLECFGSNTIMLLNNTIQALISNCTFTWSRIRCTGICQYPTFLGNCFDSSYETCVQFESQVTGLRMEHNLFEGYPVRGIVCQAPISGVIANNVFLGGSSMYGGYAVEVSDANAGEGSGCTFTGNYIHGWMYGLSLLSAYSWAISGNRIESCDMGMRMLSCGNCSISGNVLMRNKKGIYLSLDSNQNVISGNRIDTSRCDSSDYPVEIISGDNNLVIGNLMLGKSYVNGGAGNVFVNNVN